MFFDDLHHKYYKNISDFKAKKTDYISGSKVPEIFGNPYNEEYWSLYKAYEKVLCDKADLPYNPEDKDVKELRKRYFKENFIKKFNPNYNYGDYALFNYLRMFADESKVKEQRKMIVNEWRFINKDSTNKGTIYHEDQEYESIVRGYEVNPFNNERFNTIVPHEFLDKYVKQRTVDIDNLKRGFYPEIIVDYKNYIGQIDKLWVDAPYFWIDDYKTNKKINTDNRFDKMKDPVSHLDDCNYNHYRLQLSFYAWILEKRGYKCEGIRFTHFDKPYVFDMLRKEIEDIITHIEFDIFM